MSDGKKITSLMCELVGFSKCVEGEELIILFENGEKFTLKSFASFNCDGNAYFSIPMKSYQTFRTIPVKKIKITHGRSYESITNTPSDPKYFIKVIGCLDKGVFKETTLD